MALEATMVHSAAGVRLPSVGMIRRAPFRAPHHSSSMVSLVGGGTSNLRPGEISLAHAGVLFLDELGEFSPMVLDGLRQPLEEGVIRVARARASATLPARFLLVAATNPCPCGGGAARRMSVRRRCTAAVPPAAQRATARSVRSPRRRRSTRHRRSVAQWRRRVHRRGSGPSRDCRVPRPSSCAACSTARYRRRISTSSLRCSPMPDRCCATSSSANG